MPTDRALKLPQVLIVPLLAGSIGFVGVVGPVWYVYVTIGTSPDDPTGVLLNSHVPAFLRTWGCARITQRFPKSPPPRGCERN